MKTEYGVEVTFPVAPFSVVLGFGLILITEQAVLHFQVPPILEHPLASFSQEQMVVGVREERQPLMHSTPGWGIEIFSQLFKKWCICAHWHWREFEFKMGLKSTFRHNHRGRRTGSVVQGVSDEVHGTCLISMFSMTCEKSNLFPGAPWRRWSWRPPTHQPWCFPALESPLDPSPHRPLLPLSLWGESLRL